VNLNHHQHLSTINHASTESELEEPETGPQLASLHQHHHSGLIKREIAGRSGSQRPSKTDQNQCSALGLKNKNAIG